jgi:hypothetical protein
MISCGVFIAGLLLLIVACQPATPPVAPTIQQFIFLGHPYDWLKEDRIDPRLELLDYSHYQGVWLGGDVCARTSKSAATLAYLDSIFDLKSQQTLWAWGNHDLLEGDADLLLVATGRPSYYTHWQDGLQLIVLNTNLFWHHPWGPAQEDCAAKAAQLDWLKSVLDTVQAASHLVLLHHHGLFNELKVDQVGDTLLLDNVRGMPVRPDCQESGDFTAEIYPLLKAIREQGIEVVSISGDVGMVSKGYAITTPDRIHLLGSGINNSLDKQYPPDYVKNFQPDSILLIQFAAQVPALSWEFVSLSTLVKSNLSGAVLDKLPPRIRQLLAED